MRTGLSLDTVYLMYCCTGMKDKNLNFLTFILSFISKFD
jgi:hypothetical protein